MVENTERCGRFLSGSTRTDRQSPFTRGRRPLSLIVRLCIAMCCVTLASVAGVVNQAGAAPTQWSVTHVPKPVDGYSGILSGVSCTRSTFCVSVGRYGNAAGGQPLIESWNGTAWSVIPSPNPGSGSDNGFDSVSCVSRTFCVAVGGYNATTRGVANLIEPWNGTSWSVTSNPNAGSGDNGLQGVCCTSSTFCEAVGGYDGSKALACGFALAPAVGAAPVAPSTRPSCRRRPSPHTSTPCSSARWLSRRSRSMASL
jgi:hypothetical protein